MECLQWGGWLSDMIVAAMVVTLACITPLLCNVAGVR